MTTGLADEGIDTGNVPRPKAISIVPCLVTVIRISEVIHAYLGSVPIGSKVIEVCARGTRNHLLAEPSKNSPPARCPRALGDERAPRQRPRSHPVKRSARRIGGPVHAVRVTGDDRNVVSAS